MHNVISFIIIFNFAECELFEPTLREPPTLFEVFAPIVGTIKLE